MSDQDFSELEFSPEELEEFEDEGVPVLRFDIGDVRVGVEASLVAQVVPTPKATSLPGLPSHVLGAFVLGGRACALTDIARWMHLTDKRADGPFTIVIEHEGWRVGMVAKGLSQIEPISFEMDGDAFGVRPGRLNDYTEHTYWVPGGVVSVLNIPKLLKDMAIDIASEEA